MLFVLGYDICEPSRLTRIHRAMISHATPIEYSIFLLDGSYTDLRHCLNAVTPLMDKRDDDVRVYPLPSRGLQCRLGKQVLPDGIVWTGFPVAWQ